MEVSHHRRRQQADPGYLTPFQICAARSAKQRAIEFLGKLLRCRSSSAMSDLHQGKISDVYSRTFTHVIKPRTRSTSLDKVRRAPRKHAEVASVTTGGNVTWNLRSFAPAVKLWSFFFLVYSRSHRCWCLPSHCSVLTAD